MMRRFNPQKIALALAVLAAAVLFIVPVPDGASPAVFRAAGVVVLSVGLWATGVVPEYFGSIIFFLVAVVAGSAPPSVVFSGFHSGAAWVIFGGLVIGVAVQATGLGARLARGLVGLFPDTYLGILAGVVVVGVALAFVMPSTTGRVVILMPIIMGLADRIGFEPGSQGRTGMALAVGTGTLFPTFAILPASVPNLGMIGAAESIYGIHLTYGSYLQTNFPVLGLVPMVAMPLLIARLFPDTPRRAEVHAAQSPPSDRELRLAAFLLGALALWITDFMHGVAPAWVAVGAAVLILMPRIGVLPTSTLVEKINYAPWFFVVGVIGMGAFVTHTGLGGALARLLFSMVEIERGADFANYLIIVALGMVMGMVASMPGQPGIMAPLAGGIAEATGWPVYDVLMSIVPSWQLVLFPFELPPVVVACHLGGIRLGQVARLFVWFTALVGPVMVVLQFLWLRLLGLLA